MAFAITSDGHGFILEGELDMAGEREFASAFDMVLGFGGPATVDMRKLQFMDWSGIKVIIAAAKGALDARIILHGVHDSVQKVVEMTGIDQIPNLHVMPVASASPPRPRQPPPAPPPATGGRQRLSSSPGALRDVIRNLPAAFAGAALHPPVALPVMHPKDCPEDGGIGRVSVSHSPGAKGGR